MNKETIDFNTLYRTHNARVKHTVKKYIKDNLDVEEVVNDCFLKAYNNIATFNSNLSQFETWLHNITKNTAIDFLRKKKLNTFSINDTFGDEENPITYEIIDKSLTPHELMVKKERNNKTREVIDSLPEGIKLLMQMHYLEELKYKEISTKMDMPLGTVKVMIMRGRELMKQGIKY